MLPERIRQASEITLLELLETHAEACEILLRELNRRNYSLTDGDENAN